MRRKITQAENAKSDDTATVLRRRRPGKPVVQRRRPRGCGNRCGHNPRDPRLTLAQPASARSPKILRALERHLREYYDRPRDTLPSLTFVKVQGHDGDRERLPSSARREACLLLLFAMIKYLDLARLCVGVPTNEGFLTLKLEFLAQQAGIGVRRAERALHDLKAANIVTVSELCELQEDGRYVGIAAIKAINKDLFAAFGLTKWLSDERGRASRRQRLQSPTGNPKQLAKLRLLIGRSGAGSLTQSKRARSRRVQQESETSVRASTGPPNRDYPRDASQSPGPLSSLAKEALASLSKK